MIPFDWEEELNAPIPDVVGQRAEMVYDILGDYSVTLIAHRVGTADGTPGIVDYWRNSSGGGTA